VGADPCLYPGTISGNISGNIRINHMDTAAKSAVARHRARLERQGLVRIEVNVRKEDASLVRRIATALTDPARQVETRRLLQQRLVETPKTRLKALLASAPLDGIDLDRSGDLGREIEL